MKNKFLQSKTYNICLILLSSVICGMCYPLYDLIMLSGEYSVFIVKLLQFCLGAIVLLPFAIMEFKKLTKYDFLISLISGVLLFLAELFLCLSINYGTPSESAIFLNLGILFVPLLYVFIGKQKASFWVWISSVIVIVALVVLTLKDATEGFNMDFGLSFLFGLISTIFYSCFTFTLSFYTKNKSVPFASTFIRVVLGAVLFLVFALIFSFDSFSMTISSTTWIYIALYGVIGLALAHFLQTRANPRLSAPLCELALAPETLFACIFSIILGIESFNWFIIISAVLVTVAIIVCAIKE